MEDGRVGESEVGCCDADIDHTTVKGRERKASRHRLRRAGGIDDGIGQLTIRHFFQSFQMRAVSLGENAVGDAEMFRAEIESALDHVHDDDFDLGHQFEKFQTSETDRASADGHGVRFAGLWVGALHGVIADGEGLDQGELVIAEVIAGMEFTGGDNKSSLTQAATVVDADNLHAGAAIREAFFRRHGIGVVHVGFQRALISGFDVRDITADGDDL